MTAHVAAVMRAGLRRGDRLRQIDDRSFTIDIAGADERIATRIAERLRGVLAQLRLPQLGTEAGLTARFGVAAGRNHDGGDVLVRRAREALDRALSQREAHVVGASEMEDVILLPAPDIQPAALAAAQ